MYAYIQGVVTQINPGFIVVENQGIGYLIISPAPYSYKIDDLVKVYTHHYTREDINNLYGFSSFEKKLLFIRLIGVSGIGPKSALSILANEALNDTILAIEEGNIKYLTQFPGIGLKTAQQIILDLKGKLIEDQNELIAPKESDVKEALGALGFSRIEIKKAIKKLDCSQSVELMIKQALQILIK